MSGGIEDAFAAGSSSGGVSAACLADALVVRGVDVSEGCGCSLSAVVARLGRAALEYLVFAGRSARNLATLRNFSSLPFCLMHAPRAGLLVLIVILLKYALQIEAFCDSCKCISINLIFLFIFFADVYCQGPLLDTIQQAGLFPDSKTFVGKLS